jgi:hypothetical protein
MINFIQHLTVQISIKSLENKKSLKRDIIVHSISLTQILSIFIKRLSVACYQGLYRQAKKKKHRPYLQGNQ